MTIRTLSSRDVYRNPWMTVREDSIQRQDGSTGIYGVVLKPDFSIVVSDIWTRSPRSRTRSRSGRRRTSRSRPSP